MQIKPVVVLSLNAISGVVPGKPAENAEKSAEKSSTQPSQEQLSAHARNQETHNRLFGGYPGWVTQEDGSVVWIGPSVK